MSARRAVAFLAAVLVFGGTAAVPASAHLPQTTTVAAAELPRWRWPLPTATVVRPFEAPAHRYGAGHRGVDLAAEPGTAIGAPAPGTIVFSGRVVDREVVTIDHGGGLVSTFEPVVSPLPAGTTVDAGDVVAVVGVGAHTAPGAVHFGVRHDGEYVDPMLLLGEARRAILLPCC